MSYQASRAGFAARGIGARDADALMLRSVALAERARDEEHSDTIVAASLGPYGAMLHDGSEYRGRYGVSAEVLRDFHAQRIELFDGSRADAIALETIPGCDEAVVLAELLGDIEKPAWISFSCRDGGHLSDGTVVEEAVALFNAHPAVCAVGVNCTPPQYIAELLSRIRAVTDRAILAYPNSGETYNAGDGSWTGSATPIDYANAARTWIEAGAQGIGGCCRTGPEHIRALSRVTGNH